MDTGNTTNKSLRLKSLLSGDGELFLTRPLCVTLEAVCEDGEENIAARAEDLGITVYGLSEDEALEALALHVISDAEVYLLSGLKLSKKAQALADKLKDYGILEALKASDGQP